MAFVLTEKLNEFVQAKLASGEFSSEEEVLWAAIRALQAREEEVAAIEEGLADVRAGRVEPFEVADAEFRRKHNITPDA